MFDRNLILEASQNCSIEIIVAICPAFENYIFQKDFMSELVCRLIYEEKRLYIHEGVG
jgi:hypothetical protein